MATFAVAAIGVAERPSLVLGFLAAALVFIPLEQVLPLVPRAGLRRDAWVDVVHVFANRIPITVGTGLVLAAVAPPVRDAVPEALRAEVLAWPVWVQFVAALLLTDLINYWSHRLLHEVPALWRLHAVHHSSEELDWLSTSRGHPLDQILTAAGGTLPLYAIGFDLPFSGAVLAVNFFVPFLVHANTSLTLRPLSAVFVTPAFHHWHHARVPEAVNRNYGAVFSFWDRLFGSWYLPGTMPPAYGTSTPVAATWTGQMTHPFRVACDAGTAPAQGLVEPWNLSAARRPAHTDGTGSTAGGTARGRTRSSWARSTLAR